MEDISKRRERIKRHLATKEQLVIRRAAGEKAIVMAHASARGMSLNELVNKLIDADMEATAVEQGMTLDEYRESLSKAEAHKP